jgi:hypothetical protein
MIDVDEGYEIALASFEGKRNQKAEGLTLSSKTGRDDG